tara:strand:- start:646 stop:999 length:354 start_codon:yes stop_codon:yes gene_type:complete
MEIDKKIVKKLISALEDLKKSIGEKEIINETILEIEEIDKSKTVTSPIVGTAYLAPEPGAKKFIEVGKKIKKGDTVMIVEAMKTMNHVPSTMDGVVKKISVEDGQPVEFGQVLIVVE